MKLQTPKNPNYVCTVVEINKLVPIEGRDRIQSAIIFSNSVIVSKTLELNTKGLYFSVESQIGTKFLSKHNLFRDKTKNIDPNQPAGFFEDNGRVKCLKMGPAKSEGFFLPFHSLHEDYKELLELPVGTDFDYYNDECICRKYIIKDDPKEQKVKEARQGVAPRFNRLVDNQFHFHIDTLQARRNFHIIKPDDIISITDKWHGTSGVFSNILTKRRLKLYEKILSLLGVNINDTLYDNIYSSRKVVKNKFEKADLIDTALSSLFKLKHCFKDLNRFKFKVAYKNFRGAFLFKSNTENNSGYYSVDVWKEVNDMIKSLIPEGITLYVEIVGYLPDGAKPIQKGYTYECSVGEYKVLVYRVTNTNHIGLVTEYSWQQIKDFCNKYGLEYVKEFYYGYARDLYPDISLEGEVRTINDVEEHLSWNDLVLERLNTDFNMEKECKYNKGFFAEGIVIRPDKLFDCVPLKLKSFGFLQYETRILDTGEEDIESEESVNEEESV